MDKTRTTVKICGKDYAMAGFESEEYIHRVAIYVDRKIEELKNQYVNLNSSTLAVLAAVNIADELLKLQDQMEDMRKDCQELHDEFKKAITGMSAEHETAKSNVSSINRGTGQLFDSYK